MWVEHHNCKVNWKEKREQRRKKKKKSYEEVEQNLMNINKDKQHRNDFMFCERHKIKNYYSTKIFFSSFFSSSLLFYFYYMPVSFITTLRIYACIKRIPGKLYTAYILCLDLLIKIRFLCLLTERLNWGWGFYGERCLWWQFGVVDFECCFGW